MAGWQISWNIGDMPPPARTAALAILAVVLTSVLSGAQAGVEAVAAAPVPAPPARAQATVVDGFESPRTYATVAPPVRLRIPALHVRSSLQRLGQLPDGTVAVPVPADVAGWYEGGPRPGQPGPAVILGHVDSQKGPGIFFDLGRLKKGAAVAVDRADGSTVTFHVTSISRVPKTRFPTDLVYAPTLQPTLRLVTCGGTFDYSRRSYRDNVIVYAA
jgi:hypothetical protein